MDQFTKDLTKTLLPNGDVKELFRQQLETAINRILQAELTALLGDGGLFANVSRHYNDSYKITTDQQFEQLEAIQNSLKNALLLLTRLTDDYSSDEGKAPNELKDVIRDFLLPRVNKTLEEYRKVE